MTPSQRGRRNRRAGHDWERACALLLAAETGEDVVTTRSLTGGVQRGADLSTVIERDTDGEPVRWVQTVHGWAVECKTGEPHKVGPWLAQAKRQADNSLYAVIAKRNHKPVGDATVYMTDEALTWWLYGRSDGTEETVFMSLSAWLRLLETEPWEDVDAA